MGRRKFILVSCRACAALAAIPAIAALESCGGTKALALEPAAGSTTIDVPVSQFGSAAFVVVKTKKVGDDLLVTKQPDGSYKALVMRVDVRPLNSRRPKVELRVVPVGNPKTIEELRAQASL